LTWIRRHLDLFHLIGAAMVLLVLVIVFRGAAIVSSRLFNPDEAELLAAGRRAALDLWPYTTYTTSTYLVLWPATLGGLAGLGVPMTLPVAHILSSLAYVWFGLVAWWGFSRRFGWLLAGCFVLPTAAVLLAGPGPRQYDFLSLGTELLPSSIVLLGAVVLLGGDGRPTRRRLGAACFLAGSALWAKPQIAPLALALCLVGLLVRRLSADEVPGDASAGHHSAGAILRDVAVGAAAFAAPTLLILLIIVMSGTVRQFLDEPVAVILSYLGAHQGAGSSGPPATLGHRIGLAVRAALGQPFAYLWMLPGIVGLRAAWQIRRRRPVVLWAVIWLAPVAAGVLALCVTLPIYPHYLNILYAACLVSGLGGVAVARLIEPLPAAPDRARWTQLWAPIATATAVVLAAVIMLMPVRIAAVRANVRAVAQAFRTSSTDAQATTVPGCPAQSRVLVWGWAAELYAEFDWTPASRYVTAWPLSPWGRPDVYRATLLREVTSDAPACVVEAIGPAFFGSLGPSTSIANQMPDLAGFLSRCYVESAFTLPAERPITLWRRKATCPGG